MEFIKARPQDFEIAFDFIQQLWSYNTYDRGQTQAVYQRVISHPNSFFFFAVEDGVYKGMCHGDYFDTFWMAGPTCYLSSLYVVPEARGKGYGTALINETKRLARARGCRAIILDSGLPREAAHSFYQGYGFEKSCYGFELALD